jgi:5-methylcytosine-specific restriction endonuclease McrA
MPKNPVGFRMPTAMSITGRSSSITNAFVNALIPIVFPSEAEVVEALSVLGMSPNDVRCIYCGDPYTEWDHLRPLVIDQKPTGFVSELANLVPGCGRCNQSKGKKPWREWC